MTLLFLGAGPLDPEAAARAISIVDMADAQDHRISTCSKGMRQRIKVAAALVHDPRILRGRPARGLRRLPGGSGG